MDRKKEEGNQKIGLNVVFYNNYTRIIILLLYILAHFSSVVYHGREEGCVHDLRLQNGAKIAVIGAGPAGTFFADFASQLAEERGFRVSITLFDGKDFTMEGPTGCNLCAGVISETLVKRLEERGIVIPDERVQRRIEGYHLWGRAGGLLLRHRKGEKRITTVFRGNGPRFSGQSGNISFDDYLLERVKRKGIQVFSLHYESNHCIL